MKKTFALVAIMAVMIGVFSCSDDIYIEPDAPLTGDYTGEYCVTQNYGSASQSTRCEFIEWTFTEDAYIMQLDTAKFEGECFCRVDGVYALSDGIRFQEKHSIPDGAAGCTACNEADNPEGRFRIEWQGAILVLKQLDGTTYKEIRLTKK
jgi:hypothetical protein